MFEILRPYILSFIPFFVAINVAGILPVFISLTQGFRMDEKRRVIRNSVVTAGAIAIGFMFFGKGIFMVMGITISDFKIGGGILLLVLAIQLLLKGDEEVKGRVEEAGIVPLGTPLITGPAVLTTTLIMVESYGMIPTVFSFLLNILFVWIVFLRSESVVELIGLNGTRAMAKVFDIMLSAIAIMLIRQGIVEVVKASSS